MRKKPSSKNQAERLILVTNREPFHCITRDNKSIIEKTTGGLVTALEPAIKRAKEAIWISGTNNDLECSNISSNILDFQWLPVQYNPDLHDGFYYGFANRVLWPLFHSMIGNQMRFKTDDWNCYKKVNKEFAKKIQLNNQPNDFIWIHDYQLILVPEMVRKNKLAKSSAMGFFLHIPFPSYDLFRILPWRKEVLKGLLGANLIGFQIEAYCQHFFDAVENILHLKCDRKKGIITYQNRIIKVKAIPIGIDTKAVYQTISNVNVKTRSTKLRSEINTKNLIVGVDRLDYTKGIIKRLYALETFWRKYPKQRGQTSMIQLAVPTRTSIEQYQELREEIERIVGHINGLYAKPGWTPITYMCRSLPEDELFAMYHAANIGLVTPLRDGMNLVAKEFIAAHNNESGVLILSELTGSAQELKAALLVNPYDTEAIADAINLATNMPIKKQRQIMKKLNFIIEKQDVYKWVDHFINECCYE